MSSIEDKISRKVYITIGLVLCFTAIIMYRIHNNSYNGTYYLDSSDSLDENIYTNEIEKQGSFEAHGDGIDTEASKKEDSKVVEVKVEKFKIEDYTDETYWNVVLVNKKNTISKDRPITLGTLKNGKKVDARIVNITNQMIADAAKDGVSLIACSGYRSYSYQEGLFAQEYKECLAQGISEQEARDLASTEVAIPGTSEHQLGLAIDFITSNYTSLNQGFENTKAFKWLDANGYKYGYILRYMRGKEKITGISYEPWHWRYVGPELAKIIKDSGMCYEEFLGKE